MLIETPERDDISNNLNTDRSHMDAKNNQNDQPFAPNESQLAQNRPDSKCSLQVIKFDTAGGASATSLHRDSILNKSNSLVYFQQRHHGKTMKKQRSKNAEEMQIIVEEIEKIRIDKNLSKIESEVNSIDRRES